MHVGVLLVEETDQGAGVLFFCRGDVCGTLEVSNWSMFCQGNGLVAGREESVAPVGFSIGRFAPNVLDGDIGGEVVVVAAQRVTGPGTSGRETFGGMSGVDEDTAGTVGNTSSKTSSGRPTRSFAAEQRQV